jgi:hypothetical protein
MANKPNNPALWSRAKSLARQKFDVYPSAYANGWAAKWYKGKGGSWRTAEYGMQVNDEMADGGEKMPPEIARARFAAAGNLDQMGSYGYAYGGYSPEMMHGGYHYMQQGGSQDQVMQIIQMYAQMNKIDPKQLMQQLQQMPAEQQKQAIQQMMQTVQQGGGAQQQPDMQQAAMAYGGYITGMFAEGGETENGDTNAGMAMGQIAAMHDKLSRLQKFITSPDTEVDPWVASKITLADDYLNSVADYMQYGEQQESENEMSDDDNEQGEMMANGGYTVTRSNDRKGKTHKVTGPGGVVKYFGDSNLGQHPKDPKRKAAFYARHKHNLDNNPFFRAFARKTWKDGGSTFSGNAWYENGGTNNPGFRALPEYVQHQILSNMAYGGIHLDPAKKGTFKAQATRMGMGVQEAASTILNAPEGRYSPAMRKKANFAKNFAKQMGGPVEGDVLDVTPEELHMLKQGGYNFEIID